MIKSSEVQATQSEIRDEIDEVTRLCKAVKMRLDELDTINAQMLADDVVRCMLRPLEALLWRKSHNIQTVG